MCSRVTDVQGRFWACVTGAARLGLDTEPVRRQLACDRTSCLGRAVGGWGGASLQKQKESQLGAGGLQAEGSVVT